MLQFLPYALAAYGGYQGYKRNKDAGASGLNRILGAVTGATAGYYGGKGILAGGTNLGIPGFSAASDSFTKFTQLPGVNLPFMPQNTGAQIPTGQKNFPFLGQDPGDQMGLVGNEGQVPTADKRTMLQKLLMRKRYED